MNKLTARLMLSSIIFFSASLICFMIPAMKDEKLRKLGFSDVEHSLGAWDYSAILLFCIACGLILAGILLNLNKE